ncbi:hypothetical protein BGAL_0580g00010 [Botrytis galanthina]|uniref:Uncharacterized protein n=1 Tax=Botrytis galanthina TaxID=278940 RepID=A0A4S8QJQ6_9HELO|nr:hypothetical protein BGAL_0580g00010 [Botrytis galanthina]
MPPPSQGTGKDPSGWIRKQSNAFAQLKQKTNTPKAQAAIEAERKAKRSEFREIYKVFEDVAASMEADPKIQAEKKAHDEKMEKQKRKLLREKIEKDVAAARAKQNREEEEELKRIGNSSAVGAEKKRLDRKSGSSSMDKPKRNGNVKKPVT